MTDRIEINSLNTTPTIYITIKFDEDGLKLLKWEYPQDCGRNIPFLFAFKHMIMQNALWPPSYPTVWPHVHSLQLFYRIEPNLENWVPMKRPQF